MKWTHEQQAAIDYRGGSAIVSAAAGSGKTAVLVERIVGILTDVVVKTPADKLVVCTFTVKAAEELRLRLSARLAEIAKDSSANIDEQSLWISEQLIRLEEAHISTISSFCMSLLKGNEDKVGLSSGFAILEEDIERAQIRENALSATMQSLYSAAFTDSERELVHKIYGLPKDSHIKGWILNLYDSAMLQTQPQLWVEEKARLYEDVQPFKRELLPQLAQTIDTQKEIALRETQFLQTQDGTDTTGLAADLIELERFTLSDNSTDHEIQALLSIELSRKPRKTKAISDEQNELLKNHYKIRATAFAEITKLLTLYVSFEQTANIQKEYIKVLVRLYNIFCQNFSQLKSDANSIDFADVEQLCLKMLRENIDGVRERLSSSFYEIVVDEFQDSNRVQYEIFRLLSKNEDNLFFVGDVKQSIYRFRSADPSVFIEILDNPKYKTMVLRKNFRSSNGIIQAVNDVFEGVMTKRYGGVEYDADHALVWGNGVDYGEKGTAQLALLDKKEISDSGLSVTEAEAIYIARCILEMVDSKKHVTLKDGSTRPCQFGDFAIIFSALSSREKTYLKVFELMGIPVSRGGNSGEYLSLSEIDMMIKLLQVIFDPYRSFELLNVIMSPMFNFTTEEVAQLRGSGEGNQKNLPLYSAILASAQGAGNSALKEKSARFVSYFNKWRIVSENQSLPFLLRQIAQSEPISLLISASNNPQKADANINLLLYYSMSLNDFCRNSPHQLLTLLEKIKKGGRSMSEADIVDNSPTGLVKLMTIHASKGLEYPICFLADFGKLFNFTETKDMVMFDKDIGFAMQYVDPDSLIKFDTLTHLLAEKETKAKSVDEEIRKLYVALTRARDYLFIVGSMHQDKVREHSFLYPLLGSRAVQNGTLRVEQVQPAQYSASLLPVAGNDVGIIKETDLGTSGESDRIDTLSAQIGALSHYSRLPLMGMPKKLTATEVNLTYAGSKISPNNSNENLSAPPELVSDEPLLFPRSPSFLKDKRLSGKKRGDAYHKAMELIDFAKGDYSAQLASMSDRFTPEEFACINPAHIEGFFSSTLGRRASAAKVEKEYPLYTQVDFSTLGFDSEYDTNFLERPFIQGIADMFFYEDGEIVLVDYKTNRNTPHSRFIELYKGQLTIYKKAIEEMTGNRVKECWIYSFEIGEIKVDV